MERIIEILFNTNHEMPSGYVLMALIVIAIATNATMTYMRNHRDSGHRRTDKKDARDDSKNNIGKKDK